MCRKVTSIHKFAAPCYYYLRIPAEDNQVVGAELDKFGATDLVNDGGKTDTKPRTSSAVVRSAKSMSKGKYTQANR